MHRYLEHTEFIDTGHAAIRRKATGLAAGCDSDVEIARRCFEFVRDEIKHSWDHGLNPVTYRASEVLRYRTGYCYAKSHLLAALLRANGLPAGLCYQRLLLDGDSVYCLHGLNAVYLQEFGWYRMDPRGPKAGLYSEFCPPLEKLPFPTPAVGEGTFPRIWAEPLPAVIGVLLGSYTFREVAEKLPDMPLSAAEKLLAEDVLAHPVNRC